MSETDVTAEQRSRIVGGALLRAERTRAGLTLVRAAKILGIGHGFLSDVERGSRRLSPRWVVAACEAYGSSRDTTRELVLIGVMGDGWPVRDVILAEPSKPRSTVLVDILAEDESA